MTLIVEDIRLGLTVDADNLGFDGELFPLINAVKSAVVQLGVSELDIVIDETTSWPTFDSDVIAELAKEYMILKAKTIFDASASETITKAYTDFLHELEARIIHEVDEEAANA